MNGFPGGRKAWSHALKKFMKCNNCNECELTHLFEYDHIARLLKQTDGKSTSLVSGLVTGHARPAV